ncbi:hypothetical protein [Aureimonas phyllosphaerae]|uniref:Uncharacterized protein n=1 Tax=Aureimonas phyllosphaerae TaxID=1166078 RepID=A0A7W6BM41_9HYPH|nr:hypothetical protein [Aureimonas phyllosphaerae]MBB3934489.1 hypothetical protein [Aureimonas phyllosphaerae]MBB3958295.1 hypothetical protein [Aureimonas phyllosphaerae]SFE94895.1 hypothetical protein SAMN05216566_101265 [Aureimonas phyllosphaerae]
MGKRDETLLSERLFAALTAEVSALEKRPRRVPETPGEPLPKKTAAERAGEAKARVEAISQLTRTLEKLLELRQLEALSRETGRREDTAEADTLRTEMLKRLKAIDARRGGAAGLFEALAPGGEAAA